MSSSDALMKQIWIAKKRVTDGIRWVDMRLRNLSATPASIIHHNCEFVMTPSPLTQLLYPNCEESKRHRRVFGIKSCIAVNSPKGQGYPKYNNILRAYRPENTEFIMAEGPQQKFETLQLHAGHVFKQC